MQVSCSTTLSATTASTTSTPQNSSIKFSRAFSIFMTLACATVTWSRRIFCWRKGRIILRSLILAYLICIRMCKIRLKQHVVARAMQRLKWSPAKTTKACKLTSGRAALYYMRCFVDICPLRIRIPTNYTRKYWTATTASQTTYQSKAETWSKRSWTRIQKNDTQSSKLEIIRGLLRITINPKRASPTVQVSTPSTFSHRKLRFQTIFQRIQFSRIIRIKQIKK